MSKRFGAVIGVALAFVVIPIPAGISQSATLAVTVRVVDGQEQARTLGPQRNLRCVEVSPRIYQCDRARPRLPESQSAEGGAPVKKTPRLGSRGKSG